MSTPFDHFIIIDWSARKAPSPAKPSRDAIWLADGSASSKGAKGRSAPIRLRYFRTRQAAIQHLQQRLQRLHKSGKRVLVGLDFSFGYPKGLAKALRLETETAWQSIWAELHRLIEDGPLNQNNRFQVAAEFNRRLKASLGPFWGVTSGQSGIFLGARKDFSFPVKVRKKISLTEKRLVEQRHSGLQSSWKLAYTGSVGSQALLGIPYIYQLRFLSGDQFGLPQVWPFDTGLQYPQSGQIIFAEIWPSLVPRPRKDAIPDREQVKVYLQWLRDEQQAGRLVRHFQGPTDLSSEERQQVTQHEGWVLGIH